MQCNVQIVYIFYTVEWTCTFIYLFIPFFFKVLLFFSCYTKCRRFFFIHYTVHLYIYFNLYYNGVSFAYIITIWYLQDNYVKRKLQVSLGKLSFKFKTEIERKYNQKNNNIILYSRDKFILYTAQIYVYIFSMSFLEIFQFIVYIHLCYII